VKKFLVLDIFSCKNFNTDKAVEIITKAFKIGKHDKQVLNRGREFPKNIQLAAEIIKEDRREIKTAKF